MQIKLERHPRTMQRVTRLNVDFCRDYWRKTKTRAALTRYLTAMRRHVKAVGQPLITKTLRVKDGVICWPTPWALR
jgi:hypothetical protein